MKNLDVKQQLYNQCLEFIDNRLHTVQNTITEIQDSLLSETKSSAGDKHETGRAMLQLEREKAGQQLAEIKKVKQRFSKIDFKNTSDKIGLGSLVYTTQANYFITISAGRLQADQEAFFAISGNTPIGKLLIGKCEGDELAFNGKGFIIKKII